MKILVTGDAVVHHIFINTTNEVINLDALSMLVI